MAEIDQRGKRRGKKLRAGRERNFELAYGFDLAFKSVPSRIITSSECDGYDIALYGRLGLQCYNFQKGTNLKFRRWEKYSTVYTSELDHYITLEAKDESCNTLVSLQTLVSNVGRRIRAHTDTNTTYVIDTWRSLACRFRCNQPMDDVWDKDKAIDKFYTGAMPIWLSDEALNSDNNKYYVVQESELHENDWLHLLMEFAFFSKANYQVEASPPLEINKVVVETKEEEAEARQKLKAENAIFYISYKFKGGVGSASDHQAIIRKTMDGKPGHMSLEVASLEE